MKSFDNSFLSDKVELIAGVDEAGRGPLAGPVVAAAVVFDPNVYIEGVNDSKKLSSSTRENLYGQIIKQCLSFGIGIVSEKEIDKINILQATLKAMKKAVNKLRLKPDLILIDGNKKFDSKYNAITVVKGDSKSFAIAAASILAKVTRDNIMQMHSDNFPEYIFHKNKGYGTREHIEAIKKHGASKIHRQSFLGKIIGTEKTELSYKPGEN
ncbi:MAG: ribonuclease HII [Melioribacteraceae bacterium]|nr:ribonuclease HII [Melioribacteraceae bacterium]